MARVKGAAKKARVSSLAPAAPVAPPPPTQNASSKARKSVSPAKNIPLRRNPPRRAKRNSRIFAADFFTRNVRRRTVTEKPITFLDCIPFDSLENIVRFTSARPRVPEWQFHISAADFLSFHKFGGALGDVLMQRFTRIDACDIIPADRRGILVRGKGAESRLQFPRVVAALADQLTEVRVVRPTFPNTFMRALQRPLPELRELTLRTHPGKDGHIPLADILTAHQGKLEALELCWKTLDSRDAKAIAENCRGLERLHMHFAKVPCLETMLSAVGKTLKEFALKLCPLRRNWAAASGFGEFFERVSGLYDLCPHLNTLRLSFIPFIYVSDVAAVVARYGEQLKVFAVAQSRFPSQHFKTIVNACPNVLIDCAEGQGTPVEVMRAIGPRLRATNMGVRSFPDFHIPLENSWKRMSKACTNIESLSLNDCNGRIVVPEETFNIFFSFPKPQLRAIDLINVPTLIVSSVMNALGEHTAALEYFDLFGPFPDIDVLMDFAKACKNLCSLKLRHLSGMYVGTYCTCSSNLLNDNLRTDSNFGTILTAFLKCKNIREIDLSCNLANRRGPVKQFAQDSFPARARGISVTICCHNYT